MSWGTPSVPQIRDRVKALRDKGKTSAIIGFHSGGNYEGPESFAFDGETVQIAQSDCVLEIRELLEKAGNDSHTLVVLTSLPESELGHDVIARLAGRRLYRADSWEAAMARFGAHSVDPRIAREGWIADLLLELQGGDFPTVPSGYLDASTVWQTLLGRRLGLSDSRPDALALLRWIATPGSVERYCSADPKLRAGFKQWLALSMAGDAGVAIADCVETTRNTDAIAVGLAFDVLTASMSDAASALRICAARLERMHGNRSLGEPAARAWAGAARQLIGDAARDGNAECVAAWLKRADDLLNEIGAGSYAYLGDTSPLGFNQRLDRYAADIEAVLSRANIAGVEAAASAVLRHREATRAGATALRVEMSRRLVRWLTRQKESGVPVRSLAEAAQVYAAEGAWVDRARMPLRGGESPLALSRAYEKLFEQARVEREKENERFGRLLVEWNRGAPKNDKILKVEEVLGEVVAPLAATKPVLMIVFDGVSLSIFYEFLDSLAQRQWAVFVRKESVKKEGLRLGIIPGIAALPSITEVSRASLLAGELTRGRSNLEKAKFAANGALVAVSKPGLPPVLFHKGELTDSGGTALSRGVRDAIASPDQRVVGVVVNAVDDHLSGPEQVRPQWSLDYFSQHVAALLDEASRADRVVVFASDHGHVLDADTEARKADNGDRWRAADGPAEDGEFAIAGGRVDSPAGSAIIAAWSERLRYGGKKNGYHGGITTQEVVVPVCVMARSGTKLDGRVESWPSVPNWWEEDDSATPVGQGALFTQPGEAEVAPRLEWLDRLVKSEAFKAQKELAGRGAPTDSEVRQLVEVLIARDGKLTRNALAQRLAMAPIRVAGRVAAVRRLLNLEGYQVLRHEVASDTVELDVEALRKQFEV